MPLVPIQEHPGRTHSHCLILKSLPCPFSLSLYLTFRAAGSFRDPWQTARSILKNLLVLSLSLPTLVPLVPSETPWKTEPSILTSLLVLSRCLSAPVPLVPSGTDLTLTPENLSCPVSLSHLSSRWFLQGPLADRTLNPEKPSCLVSLSL